MNILNMGSIRHRFIFTLVSIVSFSFLVFSAIIIYQDVNVIETQLDNQLLDASELAEKNLPSALWQYNYDYVKDFIESLFLFEDIVFVKVMSGNEFIKERSRSDFSGKNFSFFKQSPRFATKETNISFEEKLIGKIQIVLTHDRIKKTVLNHIVFRSIFLILLISTIISVIYFISAHHIFTPLSKLEDSATKITGGDWDVEIDASGTDEIAHLAQTFDQMIKKLKTTTASRDVLEHEIIHRKQVEAQLKVALKEKETLLQEIHHRVKNNMNVISSLIKLQANNIEDTQIKNILRESQSRVYAMAAVHETLHGSDNLSQIDLKTYLSKVTSSVFQTYSVARDKVKLNIDIKESPININQASPLGLVINELISNSLKYAFPDERKGEITVNMKKLDKELVLIVMDDGIGIPDNLEWKNSKSLGLKLVRTLVENQLDGSIDMESKNGTKFIIKFNIET